MLDYARRHRDALLVELRREGALLFRNFAVDNVEVFQAFLRCLEPKLRNYLGGDSPRSAVTDKVYTSTVYPAALPIALHNEMSYTKDYPSLIAFYCEVAPQERGETPVADCRRVLRSLPAELVERFSTKKVRYLQNLAAGKGIGKPWQATFETEDRAQVEDILRRRGAEFEWKADGSLRSAEIVDPIVSHPVTGEQVFFSQAHMWHVSSLDPKTRAALLKMMREEDLYHHCTFGDGSPIPESDLDVIRGALGDATVMFPWAKHDVLLLDNVLVAHGRSPFKGERRILVAMG